MTVLPIIEGPVPGRLRRAWCELTGGHTHAVHRATDKNVVRYLQFRCTRCGHTTPWKGRRMLRTVARRAALAQAEER